MTSTFGVMFVANPEDCRKRTCPSKEGLSTKISFWQLKAVAVCRPSDCEDRTTALHTSSAINGTWVQTLGFLSSAKSVSGTKRLMLALSTIP